MEVLDFQPRPENPDSTQNEISDSFGGTTLEKPDQAEESLPIANETIESAHDITSQVTCNPAYKDAHVPFTCIQCRNNDYTIFTYRTGYLPYAIMVIVTCLIGIFASMLVVPLVLVLPITRTYFHRCPYCSKEVGSGSKEIGILGPVLPKGFFFKTLIVTALIGLYIHRLERIHRGRYSTPIVEIKETWNDYIQECGLKAIVVEDRTDEKKSRDCQDKYNEKTILWQGYVIRIEDHRNSIFSFMNHAIVLLVKMIPTENDNSPDIILALDSEKAREMEDLIVSLDSGTEITFNATIINAADENKKPHLHLLDLKKGEGEIEVPIYTHERGKYYDKPKFSRNAPSSGSGDTSNDNDENKEP